MNRMVSIIITTYQRPVNVVERAIRSAVEQTYDYKEIIVINDAPLYANRNEIESMIKKYPVKYYVNEMTMGAGYSRNRGASLSKGAYIAYLDDDDEWYEEKISLMMECFKEDIGLVYCDLMICKGSKTYIQYQKKYTPDRVVKNLLYKNYIGGFSGPIIKKDVFESCGRMDERFKSKQDLDLWIRIASKSQIAKLDKPLVNYYISDESITLNKDNRYQGFKLFQDKYKDIYRKYPYYKMLAINAYIQSCIILGWNKMAWDVYIEEYAWYEKILNIYVFPMVYLKQFIKKIIR